jgi:hypothetical protein
MLINSGFMFFNILLTLTISTGHIKADLSVVIVSSATAARECELIIHKSTRTATDC